jgi:adenine phosphoribosyltransferase
LEAEESSYIAAKLLCGLKEVFTFKELEELLGIPAQVLWRYTSFSHFPERQTSRKIIEAIRSQSLVEKALQRALLGKQGVLEEWRLLFNPRVLDLVGYLAWRKLADSEVDLVLTYPERNAAVAAILAGWFSAGVCVASERGRASWGKLLSSQYISSERDEVVYVHAPRDAVEKDSKVLIVESITANLEPLGALLSLVEQAKAHLSAVLVVLALSDGWVKTAEKLGVLDKVRVLMAKTPEGIRFLP